MSCDAAAFSVMLWLASTSATPTPPGAPPQSVTPPSVASEPFFVDLVRRASALKAETDAYEKGPLDGGMTSANGFSKFEADVAQLSDLDMQGHTILVQRGYTDDLKCILKGISQDLPVKLQALEVAADAKARHDALRDMSYLLNDNVEVITAPPQPAA